jgi:hypothetical protein
VINSTGNSQASGVIYHMDITRASCVMYSAGYSQANSVMYPAGYRQGYLRDVFSWI